MQKYRKNHYLRPLVVPILIILSVFITTNHANSATSNTLQSKYFQRQFMENIHLYVNNSTEIYLNEYLKRIKISIHNSNFTNGWQIPSDGDSVYGKVRFIKQWLDLKKSLNDSERIQLYEERSILHVLRNLQFIQKLRTQFRLWYQEAEDELYNLRYFILCKKLQRVNIHLTNASVKLMPINEISVVEALKKYNILEKHTINIDVKQFGIDLNGRIQMEATSILNDFLLFVKHSLEEIILDEESKRGDEENVNENPFINQNTTVQKNLIKLKNNNTEKLFKIINDIENLLETNDHDLYERRQIIYQYIQENRTLYEENIELIQEIDNNGSKASTNSDFIGQIFNKLQTKGLQFMRIFLFSNFEFLELLHRHWTDLLPQAPLSFFMHNDRANNTNVNHQYADVAGERVGGHLLREVQLRYEDFRRDFTNADIYYEYLETVRRLSEACKDNGKDPTHIFEMMYSTSQNVATLREDIMVAKCREMLMLMK